mmetsp:Transcript_10750/g.21798  ORF Transcript_10750/g.21798 Transcript_10750/m.21798 type:complete len:293 (-) Transcript_10750:155-1033(-)
MEKGSLLDLEASNETALNPQTLSFQEFSSSGSAAAGSSAPQQLSRIGNQMNSEALKPAQDTGGFSDPSVVPVPSGAAAFWTISYYQPLFDVDTVQVLNRIKGSLLPRPRGAFFEMIAANPDLYGPFWVATTLIFAMAITGNLATYIAFVPGKKDETGKEIKWTYDFQQLTVAGSVVYSYVTLLPLLFWLLLRYYEASKKLADVLCIYGYTVAIFVPISILCVAPSNLLRWLLVLLGGAISSIFLLSNFHAHLADCFPYGEGDAKKKTYSLLGLMLIFHLVLVFVFKLYFFHT